MKDARRIHESFIGLPRLAMVEDQVGLAHTLRQIADYAAQAIPGVDGVGLALLEPDRCVSLAATTELVWRADTIQYDLHEGPGINATTESRTVYSRSIGVDRHWPNSGPKLAQLGVHSVLALPLLARDEILGAISAYAFRPDAFDRSAIELGEEFAVSAATMVKNAQSLAIVERLTAKLRVALANRAIIDQATGILMSRGGGTSADAVNQLEALSRVSNQTVAEVAETVVGEAVRHANLPRSPN